MPASEDAARTRISSRVFNRMLRVLLVDRMPRSPSACDVSCDAPLIYIREQIRRGFSEERMDCPDCAGLARRLHQIDQLRESVERDNRRAQEIAGEMRRRIVEKQGWSLRGRNARTKDLNALVSVRRPGGRPSKLAALTIWDRGLVERWLDAHRTDDLSGHEVPDDARLRGALDVAAEAALTGDVEYYERRVDRFMYRVLAVLFGCSESAVRKVLLRLTAVFDGKEFLDPVTCPRCRQDDVAEDDCPRCGEWVGHLRKILRPGWPRWEVKLREALRLMAGRSHEEEAQRMREGLDPGPLPVNGL